MSVQTILDVIKAEGSNRIRQIEEETRQQTEALLQQAQAEAEAERDRLIAMHRKRGLEAQNRKLQTVNQQCALLMDRTRQDLVNSVLDQTKACLLAVRQNPCYPEVLKHLAWEALEELGPSLRDGEEPVLQVDPADESQLHALPDDICVEYTLDCLGGVVARSPDGRVLVNNTLEARMERAMSYLRRFVARALLDG